VGRTDLPAGRLTFLFTDIAGSTKLLHTLGESRYADALAEHRRSLRVVFARHGGVEVDTQGDAFFVAFADTREAVAAATEGQAVLAGGPIKVRVGLHTGVPLRTEEGYVGIDVHRAARIAAAGHGGQVLLSAATAAFVGNDSPPLRDLGEHRLKDLTAPEHLYQVGDGEFPPLNALSASNLPVATTPFLGRRAELEALSVMLRDRSVRLISVTGPGGIGKTRLAVQAAAESSASFPGGLWWVPLASLRDATLVLISLARALGVREHEGADLADALAERLAGRRMLVLLDNAEHLLPALIAQVQWLLEASAGLTVLVTSRERLQMSSEHVFTVPPMNPADALAFFHAHAAATGLSLSPSDAVAALCERLDRLPLALQLAAARMRIFAPEQLLSRLSRRLELLKGGRDLDPRQQTLRATIEWSHDLLSPEEQVLFRRLAVFADGCTLAAAESVCGAEIDSLESLLDKSLLQRHDDAPEPRFWMLESIHGFAAEQLAASGDESDLRARHAIYFRELARRVETALTAGEPEEIPVSLLEADIDNLRVAVALGLEQRNVNLVQEITAALPIYWTDRGLYREGRTWLERALALDEEESDSRRRLMSALGTIAYSQGNHALAVRASDEAAALAMRLAGTTEHFQALKAQARAAGRRRESENAERLWREAFDAALATDNGVGISACRLSLVDLANEAGHHAHAEQLGLENLPFVRARGQTRCEAYTLTALGETSVYLGRLEDAAAYALAGTKRALQIGNASLAVFCLDIMAAALAHKDARRATTILGATDAARRTMGSVADAHEEAIRAKALEALRGAEVSIDIAWREGSTLTLESALELAAAETQVSSPAD
jgi:predicted ATPase/class 3 adenylate cyclase